MRPARDLDDPTVRIGIQAVVTAIRIRLQITLEALQELGRAIAVAAVGEVVHRVRLLPITQIGPEPRDLSAAQQGNQQLHRRVIGMNDA